MRRFGPKHVIHGTQRRKKCLNGYITSFSFHSPKNTQLGLISSDLAHCSFGCAVSDCLMGGVQTQILTPPPSPPTQPLGGPKC